MNGNDFAEKRKTLDMTQEKLARALGVTLSTVARWEADREKQIRNSIMLELALEGLAARIADKQPSQSVPVLPASSARKSRKS